MTFKSITAGVAAAALVGTLGLAYAQSAVPDSTSAVATPIESQSSDVPTYSSSDQGTMVSSDVTPSSNTEVQSYSYEPAPQADRN